GLAAEVQPASWPLVVGPSGAGVGSQLLLAGLSASWTTQVQWLRGGRVIATGSTYVVRPADAGAKISARVTATRGGRTVVVTSPEVAIAKIKAKVSVKVAKKSVKAGHKVKATITVKAPGLKKPGGKAKVTLTKGGKTIATRTVKVTKRGKATVKLPLGKAAGRYKVKVAYQGTSRVAKATKSLKVTAK
ncbi:MAG: Ig-like domain repeat protein, partial [Bifidobacteriaceae bacterium]|nr:Ig-like domain repeat protein [Bifidobacteriaceae bacterium]